MSDLAEQMRDIRGEISALHDCQADDEVEAVAAERIRSGTAERSEEGAHALADLGINVKIELAKCVKGDIDKLSAVLNRPGWRS